VADDDYERRRIVLRSRVLIAFCWGAAVGFFALFTATALSGPGPEPGPIDYIGTFVFGCLISLGFLRATRLRVEIEDRGITVFHLMRTQSVSWSELGSVSVDYHGLRLARTDGSVVTVGHLGKPNWAIWLRRRVAADERVAVIQREHAKHRRIGSA
jgi:hypothetical protein